MYKRITDVDEVISESKDNDIFILKHSNTCPISAAAKQEVDKFVEDHDVYLVVVQDQRGVSDELAEKLSVKHESPQFILVRGGVARKVLNHDEITLQNIQA